MDATLEVPVECAAPTWLNITVSGRFSGLPGNAGLRLSLDGGSECDVILDKGKGAISVAISEPSSHVVRLRSEDGARSPRTLGLSDDPRELSYRI